MNDTKISHIRLYEQVLEKIENLYNNGELNLGDKIPSERDFAKMLGVSRGTLRDALRILESQKVIVTKMGDGSYLQQDLNLLKKKDFLIEGIEKADEKDLLEAREILELGMVELICARATEEDFEYLEEIIYLSSDITKYESDHASFNLALAKCSKNVVIINFMQLNVEILKQTKIKSLQNEEVIIQSQKEHLAILNAIKKRDVLNAKKAVKYHFNKVKERYHSR